MFIYIVEALSSEDPASVSRKWRHKHRHHPLIRQAVGDLHRKVAFHECIDWDRFQKAVRDFIPWHRAVSAAHPGEIIILWLSVHGALSRTGVKFDDGQEYTMLDVLGPLSHKLSPNVVLLQSICWGGFPSISRVMNNWDYGPCLTFGPTLEVDIAALHHAERETLKLLSSHPNPAPAALRADINAVNSWGGRSHAGHHQFYRVWYWGENARRPVWYPESTLMRPVRPVT
jgi:hypothetical protein